MKIYTNGCSFVYGDELNDRENEAFPYLLNGFLLSLSSIFFL